MGYFKQLEIERGKIIMGNAGIDWGRGMTNIDHETGIRYGVISMHEVTQAWCDSSEPQYGPYCPKCGNKIAETFEKMMEVIDKKEQAGKTYHCPKCKRTLTNDDFEMSEPDSYTYEGEGYQCQQSADDPDIFILKSPFYTYCKFCSPCAPGAGYLMDYFKSRALEINGKISSPDAYKRAAENAGYIKAYCFGHYWFEDVETGKMITCVYCKGSGKRIYPEHSPIYNNGELQQCYNCDGTGKVKETIQKAPYPVFSVETGELIEP